MNFEGEIESKFGGQNNDAAEELRNVWFQEMGKDREQERGRGQRIEDQYPEYEPGMLLLGSRRDLNISAEDLIQKLKHLGVKDVTGGLSYEDRQNFNLKVDENLSLKELFEIGKEIRKLFPGIDYVLPDWKVYSVQPVGYQPGEPKS